MQIIYTGESAPETLSKSIFLAGPTPRKIKGMPAFTTNTEWGVWQNFIGSYGRMNKIKIKAS